MADRAENLTTDLLKEGYGRVPLEPNEAAILRSVLSIGQHFFDQDLAAKKRFCGANTNHGYRPLGEEFSVSPDRPDENDSFSLWNNDRSQVPHSEEITGFLDAIVAWQHVLAPLATAAFANLADHFGSSDRLVFDGASYIQLNDYHRSYDDRDYLQDAHEDGHLLTFHHATRSGLEISANDAAFASAETDDDEILVMPGSILTLMTGGAVQPLYHRVRNDQHNYRQAIMYFVNPQLDQDLPAWVSNATNAGVDILERVRTLPHMFGLPDATV